MINPVSRVQKIASGGAGTALNASLPISIKVAEKTGYNRYNLKMGNKILSTKSMKSLDVDGEYWGEIASGTENIVIRNLFKKPSLSYAAPEGLALIERLISEPDLNWFYEYIFNALSAADSRETFENLAQMLLALQKNIINISFVYNGAKGVFQMKFDGARTSQIYLVFSNFAPIIFTLKGVRIISAQTPFDKVAGLLRDEFSCEAQTTQNIAAFFDPSGKIIDFKG